MAENSNLKLAIDDIGDGVRCIHVWPMLGWQEIRQRYRRSALGPFWLTISTGLLVLSMGPLYAKLFNQDVSSYFLYLTASFVVWQLIAQFINDGCTAFISAEGFIKQIRLPLTTYVLRVVWKNIIIFFHNLLVVVAVVLFYRPALGFDLLLLPIALAILAANAIWVGLLLGLVCARFRDIPQIVTNLVQVAFFVTPVMWQPKMLGRYEWVVNFNPFYHFLEIMRAPMIGASGNPVAWAATLGLTVAGFAVMLAFFSRFRSRVAYWV